MIIYVLGGVNEAPPKRVCSVIAVNNDRTMEMESNHSMYFLVPLYNSVSGGNIAIIWRFLVVFPPLAKNIYFYTPTYMLNNGRNMYTFGCILYVFRLLLSYFIVS